MTVSVEALRKLFLRRPMNFSLTSASALDGLELLVVELFDE